MTVPVARSRQLRLPVAVQLTGLLLFLLGCAFIVVQLLSLKSTVDSQQAGQAAQSKAITQLSTALSQTRTQLQQHGITPKAPPPSTIVQGVPGASGSIGPAGASGAAGVPGVAGSPGPVGPSGSTGAVGPSGAVGPAGPAGPAGAAGQDGANGKDGQDGAQGPAGPAGPAPSGWTFTTADGTVYDCSPDSPGSTHYQCTAESGTGPQPSPSQPQPSGTAANAAYLKRSTVVVSTGPRWP